MNASTLSEQQKRDGNEKSTSRTPIDFSDKYDEYPHEFVSMAGINEIMWDGYSGQTIVAKNQKELVDEQMKSINFQQYQAGRGKRELKKDWFESMHREGTEEPATTEWPLPIAFSKKTDESLWFCLGCSGLNVMNVRDSYLILTAEVCINFWVDARVFFNPECN